MKYIKKFENTTNEIKAGDYVFVQLSEERVNFASKRILDMLRNNIGYIESVSTMNREFLWVKYEDDDEEYTIKRSEIIYHSKNKEDVQAFLDSKKYNL